MDCKELIKILEKDGWYFTGKQRGSHKYFAHPNKKGKITIPIHKGDLKIGTLTSILKQSGLK